MKTIILGLYLFYFSTNYIAVQLKSNNFLHNSGSLIHQNCDSINIEVISNVDTIYFSKIKNQTDTIFKVTELKYCWGYNNKYEYGKEIISKEEGLSFKGKRNGLWKMSYESFKSIYPKKSYYINGIEIIGVFNNKYYFLSDTINTFIKATGYPFERISDSIYCNFYKISNEYVCEFRLKDSSIISKVDIKDSISELNLILSGVYNKDIGKK